VRHGEGMDSGKRKKEKKHGINGKGVIRHTQGKGEFQESVLTRRDQIIMDRSTMDN